MKFRTIALVLALAAIQRSTWPGNVRELENCIQRAMVLASGNTITLSIDGGAVQQFAMSSTFDEEGMYFKAGDYDQTVGTSATVGAEVHFHALKVVHTP